ncbi:hypothetical protein [Psychrobacillus sp.]|uniref:hypothetical protein n=1 Tax=Psychrobacillus sp. TaxID=1871623 RepID=UPI0028BE4D16|nr:hypothetical protein [Psychrobacillus sp.]
MERIDLYIYEVTRRLPENSRADIEMELRSTILDMMPDDYTQDDVDVALTQLGNPSKLANQYRERPNYLIGPMFFESYITILKMAAAIAVLVNITVLAIEHITLFTEDVTFLESSISFIVDFIGSIIAALVGVFCWVTAIFAILERVLDDKSKASMKSKPWKPEDLKHVIPVEKKKRISKVETFIGLLGTAMWATIYFKASDIVGLYETTEPNGKLQFVAPLFNQDVLLSFGPIMGALIAFQVGLLLYKWIVGKWTNKIAIWNMIYHIALIIFTLFFINQANLFNMEFIRYTGELFDVVNDNVLISWWNNSIWGFVFVVIIISVVDIFSGFRKAKI